MILDELSSEEQRVRPYTIEARYTTGKRFGKKWTDWRCIATFTDEGMRATVLDRLAKAQDRSAEYRPVTYRQFIRRSRFPFLAQVVFWMLVCLYGGAYLLHASIEPAKAEQPK